MGLLDSLWNHYWVNTLSSSSLLTNAEYTTGQISDLADKLETWDNNMGRGAYVRGHDSTDRKAEDKLCKATTDSCKITTEVLNGLMGQVIKDRLFNQTDPTATSAATAIAATTATAATAMAD